MFRRWRYRLFYVSLILEYTNTFNAKCYSIYSSRGKSTVRWQAIPKMDGNHFDDDLKGYIPLDDVSDETPILGGPQTNGRRSVNGLGLCDRHVRVLEPRSHNFYVLFTFFY